MKSLDKRDAEFLREIRNKHLRRPLLERLNRYRTVLFVIQCVITITFVLNAISRLLGSESKGSMILFAALWGLWAFLLLNFAIVDLKIKTIKFITDE